MSDPKFATQLFETSRLGMKLLAMVSEDSSDLTKLLANLVKAAADSVGAIVLLCDGGFEREAWNIARSIFEMAITARYIRKHPDQLERYLNFSLITDKKLSAWCAANGMPFAPELAESIENNYARVEWLYDKKLKWHKGQIGQLAKEVGLGHVYEGLYPMMSNSVHAGYQLIETNVQTGFPKTLGLLFWWMMLCVLNAETKGGLKQELDALWKEHPMSTNIHIA